MAEINAAFMSAVDTLVSVAIGAIIGFLTSIGYDTWRQRREKEDLRKRIREELKLIRNDIVRSIEKRESQCLTSTEVFQVLRQDLVRKLRAEDFREIQDTYSMISNLSIAASESFFKETLATTERTLKLLDP